MKEDKKGVINTFFLKKRDFVTYLILLYARKFVSLPRKYRNEKRTRNLLKHIKQLKIKSYEEIFYTHCSYTCSR